MHLTWTIFVNLTYSEANSDAKSAFAVGNSWNNSLQIQAPVIPTGQRNRTVGQ